MVTQPEPATFSRRDDLFPLIALLSFVVLLLLSAYLEGTLWLAAVAFAVGIGLLFPLLDRAARRRDLSFFLLVPTILSAAQNVYLLFIADELDAGQIQLLIVINFLYGVLLLGLLLTLRTPEVRREDPHAPLVRRLVWLLIGLSGYGAVTTVMFGANPTSALASLRNLTTPIIFALLGLLAAQKTSVRIYAQYFVVLAALAVLFGFYELWTYNFWQSLDLAGLWEKKHLTTEASTGMPANFYSSEVIGGAQVRRMVGPFADPVNLGTFLFAGLAAAWYLKRRLATLLIAVGCALAISKGALLGVFVLIATWTRYKASTIVHLLMLAGLAAASFYFYVFTLSNSYGSTSAHINGLLAGFQELPQHPLGRGMGNIGVLAGLLGQGASSEISESGIGLILGQLGVPGLLIYVAFFWTLGKAAVRVGPVRERLLAVGLLGAFVLNGAYNEVAFSPNSAAPYFVMIGLLIGRCERREPKAAQTKVKPEPYRTPYATFSRQ